jgi:two-component system chemotaxis response regulator CheY
MAEMTGKVLAVDDSKTMRDMVSFTLTSKGFEVVLATDGEDALKKLGQDRVDLVITDINMPHMDGITLVKRLRALPNCRLTPILILTTESDSAKKQEGKAAGASGWIVKPFSPEKLIEVVNRVVT